MTGEITLTGQVLPIGGIREKSLAAQRAGLKRVICPRENEPDLDELPPETREALEFVLADTIEDVFAAAFDSTGAVGRPAVAGERQAAATFASKPGGYENTAEPTERKSMRSAKKAYSRTRGRYVERAVGDDKCATTSRTRSPRPGTSTTSSSAGAAGSPWRSVSRPTARSTRT